MPFLSLVAGRLCSFDCTVLVSCYLSMQLFAPNRPDIIFAASVSVKFRCATVDCAILTPNSQNCVALMVSAPIYVAQKQMSY